MIDPNTLAHAGLGMRPATHADAGFLETLHRSARPDLEQAAAGDADFAATLMHQQYRVLTEGSGQQHPQAMHFVVEKLGERIGAAIVDFGHNEIRVIYLALLPALRGRGHARALLQAIQQAAARLHTPVAVTVWRSNPQARRFYIALGFVAEEGGAVAERLVWYPGAGTTVVS